MCSWDKGRRLLDHFGVHVQVKAVRVWGKVTTIELSAVTKHLGTLCVQLSPLTMEKSMDGAACWLIRQQTMLSHTPACSSALHRRQACQV